MNNDTCDQFVISTLFEHGVPYPADVLAELLRRRDVSRNQIRDAVIGMRCRIADADRDDWERFLDRVDPRDSNS